MAVSPVSSVDLGLCRGSDTKRSAWRDFKRSQDVWLVKLVMGMRLGSLVRTGPTDNWRTIKLGRTGCLTNGDRGSVAMATDHSMAGPDRSRDMLKNGMKMTGQWGQWQGRVQPRLPQESRTVRFWRLSPEEMKGWVPWLFALGSVQGEHHRGGWRVGKLGLFGFKQGGLESG